MEQDMICHHLYKKSGGNNMDIYACMDIKYIWILKIPLIAFGQLRSGARGRSLIIDHFFYLSNLESYEFITFTIFLRSVGMNHLPSQNKI